MFEPLPVVPGPYTLPLSGEYMGINMSPEVQKYVAHNQIVVSLNICCCLQSDYICVLLASYKPSSSEARSLHSRSSR